MLSTVARLTSEWRRFPTAKEIEEACGLPHSSALYSIRILVKAGSLKRHGHRGYVGFEALVSPVPVVPSELSAEISRLRAAIVAAFTVLQRVDGRRVPVTLLALTARILESESARIAHEVAAMVLEGALIQIDGGYLLPEPKK